MERSFILCYNTDKSIIILIYHIHGEKVFYLENCALINLAIAIGKGMLECGGEIYRVEESIRRIGFAYHAQAVEVFAIPSSIVVTIIPKHGNPITQSKRIYNRANDLDKLDKLNNLCRKICAEKPTATDIQKELDQINNRPKYRLVTQILAYAVVSFSFTLFFGGTLSDAITAFFIGVLIKCMLHQLERLNSSAFMNNILASGITALIAVWAVHYQLADNTSKIIIGTLMNLVPGIALTNSARDFIAGDIIAGLMKLTEALLVATGIAIGVAIPLAIFF